MTNIFQILSVSVLCAFSAYILLLRYRLIYTNWAWLVNLLFTFTTCIFGIHQIQKFETTLYELTFLETLFFVGLPTTGSATLFSITLFTRFNWKTKWITVFSTAITGLWIASTFTFAHLANDKKSLHGRSLPKEIATGLKPALDSTLYNAFFTRIRNGNILQKGYYIDPTHGSLPVKMTQDIFPFCMEQGANIESMLELEAAPHTLSIKGYLADNTTSITFIQAKGHGRIVSTFRQYKKDPSGRLVMLDEKIEHQDIRFEAFFTVDDSLTLKRFHIIQ